MMTKKLMGIFVTGLMTISASAHAFIVTVPEIDGAGTFTALGLLAGAIALFAEKKRQK